MSTPPTPSQLDQPKNSNSEETFLSSRSYRSVVDKYTLGVHTVNRANIQLGVNSRVVTISGIMKVVNSFRAQGFIKGVNTPVVVFNTSDNRFDNIEVVRNSPELMAEIVTNGTLLCDAGQHREMALRYLEQPENKLPSDLPVPTHQEVEILLNVKDEYDFFVIGKKHNKVTQAQNNEHIIDQIKQVRKMWEKVKLMGGKRKQIVMADAFRLNCAEFGPEDMGATKFASYFAFYQTLSNDFMTSLENVTRKLGADPMPFKAIEVLVKKVKSPDMKGRPMLSAQLQLESLNYYERYYEEGSDRMLSSKLYDTIIVPYLIMILSMKQTAIGLLPEEEADFEMPEVVSKFFTSHIENLEVGANGLCKWPGICTGYL